MPLRQVQCEISFPEKDAENRIKNRERFLRFTQFEITSLPNKEDFQNAIQTAHGRLLSQQQKSIHPMCLPSQPGVWYIKEVDKIVLPQFRLITAGKHHTPIRNESGPDLAPVYLKDKQWKSTFQVWVYFRFVPVTRAVADAYAKANPIK